MTPHSTLNAAQRITVMGLGRFGGGVGVVRFLCALRHGRTHPVVVSDLDAPERLRESIAQIQDLVDAGQVELHLGGHDERDFTQTDLVIANPAVPMPWSNPYLQAAERSGVRITTEIRLLVERLPRRNHVIGVTGTAGKSTTSAMIAHALRVLIAEAGEANKVFLGGNIGGSLLSDVGKIGAEDPVVLELSSAQLYWLSVGDPWTPGVAVLTNIMPNHLDWHSDVEHYAACKLAMLGGDGVAIVGSSVTGGPGPDWSGPGAEISQTGPDKQARPPGRKTPGRKYVQVDAVTVPPMNLAIPGKHNRFNGQLAIEAVAAMGYARSAAALAMETFPGLPHRLQLVNETDGICAYNDSKCTTPEATALAIAAFDDPARVRLICGGYDKKIDLAPMIAPAAKCAGVYTIGTTGPTIDALVRAAGGTVQSCETLEAAVECAAKDAMPGDVILLSPGCASWDQFTNYEERGELFGRLVGGLLNMRSIDQKLGRV